MQFAAVTFYSRLGTWHVSEQKNMPRHKCKSTIGKNNWSLKITCTIVPDDYVMVILFKKRSVHGWLHSSGFLVILKLNHERLHLAKIALYTCTFTIQLLKPLLHFTREIWTDPLSRHILESEASIPRVTPDVIIEPVYIISCVIYYKR